MRIPLRVRVVLAITAVNALLFGAAFVWTTSQIRADHDERAAELERHLFRSVEHVIDYRGDVRAPEILNWYGWDNFREAVLARTPVPDASGRLAVVGAYFSIRGSGHWPPSFPEAEILAGIRGAALSKQQVPAAGGVCVPLRLPSGTAWGGAWFQREAGPDPWAVAWRMLPVFVGSTVLVTLMTIAFLQRYLIDPMRALAGASARISDGDLAARVEVPARGDELSDLCRRFNAMAAQVEGFQGKLVAEVARATATARQAEAAAMTQRRLAATGELAAGVAHEISNPLGGMLNAVESLAREDLDPARRKRYLELVQGGLERIRGTVGQLLRLAPRTTQLEDVDVAAPVSDALGLVRHRASELGLRMLLRRGAEEVADAEGLARTLFAGLPRVRGQSNELGQAVLNLLVNAADALEGRSAASGADRGTIRLSLDVEGDSLALVVEDDGPGADEETLARALDLFFTTKEQGRGTGLGLSHVHHVVTVHGGRLLLSSAPGRGFRAEIRLPYVVDANRGPA